MIVLPELWDNFCESRTGRKGSVLPELWDNSRLVRAAGGQIMHSLGLLTNIPVMIHERNLPADLIVLRLQNHDVILGMDWLGKYWATVHCHRGFVRLETGPHPIQYQSLNLSPALERVLVSAV